MGCCTELAAVPLTVAPADPCLHVNYAKGMVLGVDDFNQEFAYLAGRDQWLARDLLGYGTASGLQVRVEDAGADGPRIHVTRGSALAPSGKLICVASDQCGLINKWLEKPENAAKVSALVAVSSPPMSPPTSPPGFVAPLYLRLCYADCLTAPVPIPGEPCRSEDELMAPSRIADDFRLELRTDAPVQTEEDALRDFVAWLRGVAIVTSSPPPALVENDILAALRTAAKPWLDAFAASPPTSPLLMSPPLADYMFGSPPPGLAVAPSQLCAFLRVAFRFWVTEVRPMWMAYLCKCGADPAGDRDCLLLANINVPIAETGGKWVVDDPAGIVVDESHRPYIVHLRMLQEWVLCGLASALMV